MKKQKILIFRSEPKHVSAPYFLFPAVGALDEIGDYPLCDLQLMGMRAINGKGNCCFLVDAPALTGDAKLRFMNAGSVRAH